MKFDWTQVAGYREDMTPEEKLQFFEAYNPDEGRVSKAIFDKASSDIAALKKQARERMTEDERKDEERKQSEQELLEKLADIQKKHDELLKERAQDNYEKVFLKQKYDADSAGAMAKALASGDMSAFLGAMEKANGAYEKSLRAEMMRGTPRPDGGKETAEPSEDPAMAIARKLASQYTVSDKASQDILKHYIGQGG